MPINKDVPYSLKTVLKPNFDDIEMISFTSDFRGRQVALYNKNMISEEKVRELVKLFDTSSDPNVVFMTNAQYESIFFAQSKNAGGVYN